MNDGPPHHYTIFGAGLAGALLAVYLGRRRCAVDLYERRGDPRKGVADRGRSINLAFSTRGVTALSKVGLSDAVLATAIPMRGRMIHDVKGNLSHQPYGHAKSQAINSISRAGLNQLLIEAADACPSVTIRFDVRCASVDFDARTAQIEQLDAHDHSVISTGVVIGADGAFSAVRRSMQRRDRFNSSMDYLTHGYKELLIPPTTAGDFALDPNALHIWPRGGFMMIALPNADRTFTCTLFWPHEGANSAAQIDTPDKAEAFFQKNFPDALTLMPTFRDDFAGNPNSSLATVRCSPWHIQDRALLIGDAAHAVVPFFGQGMNAAFEDCRILDEMLQEDGEGDLAATLARFSRSRKPDTDAIADLAIANYIEMRDKVGSPLFRLKKRCERTLAKLAPGLYQPLYEMISFSNIPYADAVARVRRRRRAGRAVGVVVVLILFTIFVRMI